MSTSPNWQSGILAPVPTFGRFLTFDLRFGRDPRPALQKLRDLPEHVVVGLGAPLTLSLGSSVPGLRGFPGLSGVGCSFPSTQGALWIAIGAAEFSQVHDRARAIGAALAEDFLLREEVQCFKYREGRDLSGYVDGTENPVEDAAIEAAIVNGAGEGLDGSSFVAVQKWLHDLARFSRLSPATRDATIGREESSNEELEEAPPSAHVKRTAQESFEPPAFMVRRSMPWGGVAENGLNFVAYVRALDQFEIMLRRMAGLEDGIVDGLLSFSRAVSGGYYWCPPTRDGALDLRAIGL
jgi:putative iron-dependent peroxidase